MALAVYNLVIEDFKCNRSTISQEIMLNYADTQAAIDAITEWLAPLTMGKAVETSIRFVQPPTGGLFAWDADTDARPDVQEKVEFGFVTIADANGKVWKTRLSVPAVDDDSIFMLSPNDPNLVNFSDAGVVTFINAFTSGGFDLTSYGGAGVVEFADQRYLEIASVEYGRKAWGKRRKK